MSSPPRSLPAGPALAIIDRWLAVNAGEPLRFEETFGFSRRTINRWRVTGRVRLHDADRFACRSGLHPANLWGRLWDDVPALANDHPERELVAANQGVLPL